LDSKAEYGIQLNLAHVARIGLAKGDTSKPLSLRTGVRVVKTDSPEARWD